MLFLCVVSQLPGCDSVTPGLPGSHEADVSPEQQTQIAVTGYFKDESSMRGLTAHPRPGHPADYAMSSIMGGGVALLDYDGDGDVDIALANSVGNVRADSSPNPGFLLFQQSADGSFQNTTATVESPGLPERDTAAGFAVGDVNNDGRPDLYLTVHGEDRFFLNDGQGRFLNATAESGLSNISWGTSACFFDFDRDGWLDLFVTNYVDDTPQQCMQLSGASQDFCSPSRFAGTVDRLYRNVTGESPDRTVSFEDVTFEAGIGAVRGKGLGVVAVDLTGDHWPDLYVANDQEQNTLWVNQRDGTFVDEALVRGCALDALGNAQASMGIAVHDFDGDGRFDLLVTHLSGERNTLYRSLPDGSFADVSAQLAGCNASLPLTGFGISVFDIEGDGLDEAFVANGLVRRPDGVIADTSDFWSPYRQLDAVYSGFTTSGEPPTVPNPVESFQALTAQQSVSRGLAAGDIDGDGDIDLLITALDAPPRLLVNEFEPEVRSLRIRPVLPESGGRAALGAVVSVDAGGLRKQRLVHRAGSYLTSQLPIAHFPDRPEAPVSEVSVLWPNGRHEVFQLTANIDRTSVVVLEHGAGFESKND